MDFRVKDLPNFRRQILNLTLMMYLWSNLSDLVKTQVYCQAYFWESFMILECNKGIFHFQRWIKISEC